MRSDWIKLDSFTLETSKNDLIRIFLRNGRLKVNIKNNGCYQKISEFILGLEKIRSKWWQPNINHKVTQTKMDSRVPFDTLRVSLPSSWCLLVKFCSELCSIVCAQRFLFKKFEIAPVIKCKWTFYMIINRMLSSVSNVTETGVESEKFSRSFNLVQTHASDLDKINRLSIIDHQ